MWKKRLIYFSIICAGIILQTSIFPALFSGRFIPQAMLTLAMALTIILGFSSALPWVIAAGLFLDFFSYARVGESIIILVLAAYLVSFFSRRFLVESKRWSFAVMFLFVLAATFLRRIFFYSILAIGDRAEIGAVSFIFSYLGSEIICNSILFFSFFFAVKKIDELIFRQAIIK